MPWVGAKFIVRSLQTVFWGMSFWRSSQGYRFLCLSRTTTTTKTTTPKSNNNPCNKCPSSKLSKAVLASGSALDMAADSKYSDQDESAKPE